MLTITYDDLLMGISYQELKSKLLREVIDVFGNNIPPQVYFGYFNGGIPEILKVDFRQDIESNKLARERQKRSLELGLTSVGINHHQLPFKIVEITQSKPERNLELESKTPSPSNLPFLI